MGSRMLRQSEDCGLARRCGSKASLQTAACLCCAVPARRSLGANAHPAPTAGALDTVYPLALARLGWAVFVVRRCTLPCTLSGCRASLQPASWGQRQRGLLAVRAPGRRPGGRASGSAHSEGAADWVVQQRGVRGAAVRRPARCPTPCRDASVDFVTMLLVACRIVGELL